MSSNQCCRLCGVYYLRCIVSTPVVVPHFANAGFVGGSSAGYRYRLETAMHLLQLFENLEAPNYPPSEVPLGGIWAFLSRCKIAMVLLVSKSVCHADLQFIPCSPCAPITSWCVQRNSGFIVEVYAE